MKLHRLTLFAIPAALLLAAGCGTVEPDETEEPADTVTFIYDTHFDGFFGAEDEPNIARYATMVNSLRAAHGNPLFVAGGDDLAPSAISTNYEGEHMIPAMNQLDPVVGGVSHHEFDFGEEVAEQFFTETEFPWVNAQLLTEDGEPVPGIERWTTVDAQGITVGFFSLAREDFADATGGYPDEWQVLDQVEAAEEAVAALEDKGADIIVVAGRVPQGEKYTIAEEVDGIHAMLGSTGDVDGIDDLPDDVEDETDGPPTVVNDTIVSRVGKMFDYIGSLTLDAEGNFVDYEKYEVTTDIPEHPAMAEIVEEWRGPLVAEPAFETELELDVLVDTNYGRESVFGNLATDAMRRRAQTEYGEADVAILNPGGIRTNDTYGPGEIEGLDVLNILPFPNRLVVVEVEGQNLVDYLTGALSDIGSRFGIQPGKQVSGVQYEWSGHDYEAEAWNFYVGENELDPDDTYTVATLDFLLGARDELADAEVLWEAKGYVGSIVLEELEALDPITEDMVRTDERMLRVDEDLREPVDARLDDYVELVFDEPETAESIEANSFRAVTQNGVIADAVDAEISDSQLVVRFDADDTDALTEAAEDPAENFRVFGEYTPDEDAFGYDYDLPKAGAIDYFTLRAEVPGL